MKVFIDFSNVYHAKLSIYQQYNKLIKEEVAKAVESYIDNIVFEISKVYPIDDVILCLDSKSFRKNIYEDYKANREYGKDKISLLEYCANNNKFKTLKFDLLEADDILYLASTIYEKKCTVISSDSDMLQCKSLIYNHIKRKFVIQYSPLVEAAKKLLLGDNGDNYDKCVIKKAFGEHAVTRFIEDNFIKNIDKCMLMANTILIIDNEKLIRNYELGVYSMDTYNKYVLDINNIISTIKSI